MFTDYEWMAGTQILFLIGLPVFVVIRLASKRKNKRPTKPPVTPPAKPTRLSRDGRPGGPRK